MNNQQHKSSEMHALTLKIFMFQNLLSRFYLDFQNIARRRVI